MNIKNIIFDLGGVLIDLEPGNSVNEFAKICGREVNDLQDIILKNRNIFVDYEIGKIDSVTFRKKVAALLEHNISDFDFDSAWNSIIFDVPKTRIELLTQLKKRYRLFLFSNINDIHAIKVEEVLKKSPHASRLLDYFEKVYYSHLVNRRKPDVETFLHILEENNLDPKETLLVDDLLENTESAKQTGMHVIHVERNNPNLNFLLENIDLNS